MVVIEMTSETEHALFARLDTTAPAVFAIADSGASHVLFKDSAAHVLQQVEYSRKNDAPFAVLKAANHGVLKAIGRGFLEMADLRVRAYIFSDHDLANNLLGLLPFTNLGCTGVFKPHSFHIFKGNERTAILSGTRDSANALWRVPILSDGRTATDNIPPPAPAAGLYVEANAVQIQDNASYVRFVHACLGYPAPTTFLHAVTEGYITGPDQFPRLTTKMVRRHSPNSLATAKGHLDRARSNPPHALSDAVSARRRHHVRTTRDAKLQALAEVKTKPPAPFDPSDGPRSKTLHLDYTGPLPDVASAGTRYFQVSCWGGYINIQPLLSLRHEHTTLALKATVEFFRSHGVILDRIRMDNQQSNPLLLMAQKLNVTWDLVPPFVKNPNRSERAIRTAKNHLISVRSGFHPDCPTDHIDRCLPQIEMTLNVVRPFEYQPRVSAYEGIYGASFNFRQHPIAPVGTLVLTWDSPDHRGSWADHGVPAVYLGPALNHYRAFEVWVPTSSALRTTNTVWWFMHDVHPDEALLGSDPTHAYPPTKDRPDPKNNGADLIGRVFLEPEIGVCQITGIGPVINHRMPSRAQVQRQRAALLDAPALFQGAHYTLMYTQTSSGEEHFSSVDEILHWISSGPLLQAPSISGAQDTGATITTPAYIPATIQYVPLPTHNRPARAPIGQLTEKQRVEARAPIGQLTEKERTRELNAKHVVIGHVPPRNNPIGRSDNLEEATHHRRLSSRLHGTKPLVQPQRSSARLRQLTTAHYASSFDDTPSSDSRGANTLPDFVSPVAPAGFENLTVDEDSERFGLLLKEIDRRERNPIRHGGHDDNSSQPSCLLVTVPLAESDVDIRARPMPKMELPPVFPTRPLNLNSDGTPINYRKSHSGPHAEY